MPATLHILTRPNDPLALQVIETERACSKSAVEIVDLTGPEPDYKQLLDKIFQADAVQVW